MFGFNFQNLRQQVRMGGSKNSIDGRLQYEPIASTEPIVNPIECAYNEINYLNKFTPFVCNVILSAVTLQLVSN